MQALLCRWWLVVDDDDVDLCQSDPGHEVDLYVASSVRVMASVWIGKRSLAGALDDEEIVVVGDAGLCKTIRRWLKLSLLVDAAKQAKTLAG